MVRHYYSKAEHLVMMTQIKRSSRISTRRDRRKRIRQSPCWMTRIILVVFVVLFLLYIYIHAKRESDYFLRCNVLMNSSTRDLSKLEELNLKGCNLDAIPKNIRHCTNLRSLDVSDNPLLTFPEELRYCDKLEILFASSCPNIKTLPTVLGDLKSLTRLGWRSGSLTSIDVNAIPPNLIHLILTDNKIKSIDDPLLFKKLQHVRKLMLSHNNIESFGGHERDSQMVTELKNLELLRLAGNEIDTIPDTLFTLPKLTWLTISGNPVTNGFKAIAEEKKANSSDIPPFITMNDLHPMGQNLGQGASGKVEGYKWQDQVVAVKLIHGVTSDGKAEDELAVYKAVGSNGLNEHVVGCLALLDDGKSSKKGVVMERLSGNLDDLALPPTIIEVTADRWREDLSLKPSIVLNTLKDVATALYFLHAKIGVAHGDVYAHNMKVDWETGKVNLLDFGASYFTGDFSSQAERLEVRAFGVLVGELVQLLDMSDRSSSSTKQKLLVLYAQCLDNDVENRPSFSQIKNDLKSFYE